MTHTPYVMLSQGRVEAASNDTVVLNFDLLFEPPASTRPEPVKRMLDQLRQLLSEGESVGRWITVCEEWVEEHEFANAAE